MLFVVGPSYLVIGSHFGDDSSNTTTSTALLTGNSSSTDYGTPDGLVVPLPELLTLYGGLIGMALIGFGLFWFIGMDKSFRGSFYKSVYFIAPLLFL